MLDFIEEIYTYSNAIFELKRIAEYAYAGYSFNIGRYWNEVSEKALSFCDGIKKINPTIANNIFNNLQEACSYTSNASSNYTLFADTITDSVIPLMYQAIELTGTIDVDDDYYHFKSSKSGYLSLSNNQTGHVYNSIIDPMWEAYQHAKRIYSPKYLEFKFLGCDLGYLPYQVFCLSNSSADIYIFENNQLRIDYALNYGVLSLIPNNKLHIIIEPKYEKLLKGYTSNADIIIGDSIGYHIENELIKEYASELTDGLRNLYIQNETHSILESLVLVNTYRNIRNSKALYNELAFTKSVKQIAIIGGGPSVDYNLDYLYTNQNNMVIICVSTILKKLLANNIKPDCVVVSDPQSRTYGHFDGLSDYSTPLLLSEYAFWGFSEFYKGPKYIIPTGQNTHNVFPSETKIFNGGSTVTVLATEYAISLLPAEIHLIGLDLAYPGGQTHATGTMDSGAKNNSSIMIQSVDGSLVASSAQFQIYLKQLEELIANNKSIIFINHSKNGAFIEGTSTITKDTL